MSESPTASPASTFQAPDPDKEAYPPQTTGTLQNPEQPTFEGGWRGIATVFGSWLVFVAIFGYTYTFGVFQDFYTREYLSKYTPSTISWIGSVQSTIPFFMGTFIGTLFDKGYFHSLHLSGAIIFTFSLFMLSLAKPGQYYQIFLSQGIGMGIGFGLVYVPTITVQGLFYKRRRALATGIIMSGTLLTRM